MNMPTNALHPRLADIVEDLLQARRELHETLRSLTDEQRAARPVGDRWSVAQIVEHLVIVEGGAGRMISNLIKEAVATGERETETTSVLASLDHFGIETPTVRIEAPERVQPREGLTVEESLARLDATREKLLSVITSASGVPLAKVTAPHPALGPFNGYQWIVLIAQHERRHTRQIEAVAALSA